MSSRNIFLLSSVLGLICLSACTGEQKDGKGTASILCLTSDATAITQTSANLNGTASIKGVETGNANAYFYYSATQGDVKTLKTSGQRISAGTIPNKGGDFSANLGSLLPATTYYYVASVSIADQEELGNVKSFTTEKKTDSFSVTGAAKNVTVNSATLMAYANLPADMTGDVTLGIIYSTHSSPSLQNGKLLTSRDLDANNMYQVEVTDLTPATKYYFKSFLSRSDLNYYGEVKDFTTAQILASVSTLDARDVAETKASVGGKVEISSAGNIRKEAAVYYGADCSNIDALKTRGRKVRVDMISEDGSFTADLGGLTASTKYYYAAIVLVEGVEFTGSVKTFTTTDKSTGIAITGEAADIGDKSVTLYGWSNQEGSVETPVVFGIEYSATDLTTAATSVTASEKDAENKYSCRITDLTFNTLYYYRAFTLYNGVRTYGEVKTFKTLYTPVSSVSLDKTSITIYRGSTDATETLTATVNPSDASNTAVTWKSSNTSIATVSSSGVVTGKSKGTATITVTSNDSRDAKATCEVEVKQHVRRIILDKTWLSLLVGSEATLSVTSILPENANDTTYIWSSSDSAIASVDNSGKVITKAKGNATITATANDGSGVSASCLIMVCRIDVPQAIDMGTVVNGKNIKWASFNIGASSPEEYGLYYAWGETEPKEIYDESTYKFGRKPQISKYCTLSSYGKYDNKRILETGPDGDDVASMKLGGKWRMPTIAEWTELMEKCTWTWTTQNGVNGFLVTATNGNSIFLPATDLNSDYPGEMIKYWSSSLSVDYPNRAWNISSAFQLHTLSKNHVNRFIARTVRPVSE